MAELNACPFCRELYVASETTICPSCDIPLRPLSELPPSKEVQDQELLEVLVTHPADRRFAVGFWRRGRGALLVLAALGLTLFFAPWIEITLPDVTTISGFQLVQRRGFWFAGGAVAWGVLIPLLLSRRTVASLYGARAIAATLAAVGAVQGGLLWLVPPTSALIPLAFQWAWGMSASIGVSVAGVAVAVRLGGDPRTLPPDFGLPPEGEPSRETSDGQVLH